MPHVPAVAAVLLAAGLSTRMGQSKALLDWFGEPLVVHQVRQLRAAGASLVVVVTGYMADEVEAALAGTGAVVARNEFFREGRASSIRTGALALPRNVDTLILLNVDQPRRAETIERVLRAHLDGHNLITVPRFAGQRGHPAVLDGRLVPELSAVTESEEGLKVVMRRHSAERHSVDMPTADVLIDVNTPEAYDSAIRTWEPR